jgi:hypothetical protein
MTLQMVESSQKGRMTTSMIILAIVAALGLAAVTFVAPQVEALPPRPIPEPDYSCFDNPGYDARLEHRILINPPCRLMAD